MLCKSDIETYGFSDIIFATKTARRAISLGVSRISLRSHITRRKANITEKDDCFRNRLFLGGSGWIRTTVVEDNRFTVCPLWPLGNTPILIFWSWWTDLNPRPADYKSAALPTELHQRLHAVTRRLVYVTTDDPFCQHQISSFFH